MNPFVVRRMGFFITNNSRQNSYEIPNTYSSYNLSNSVFFIDELRSFVTHVSLEIKNSVGHAYGIDEFVHGHGFDY